MIVNLPRCAVCGIPTTPDVKYEWCVYAPRCPHTSVAYPDSKRARELALFDHGVMNVLPRAR